MIKVDALSAAPGVYSARYAMEKASFENNVTNLLHEMEGPENRAGKL